MISDHIIDLLVTEFDFSKLSFSSLIVYSAVALLSIVLVRACGPISIRDYQLERAYDSDTGPINVIYRVIAPVVVVNALLLIVGILGNSLAVEFRFLLCWLPVAFYYLVLLTLKLIRQTIHFPILVFLLQAFTSILFAVLFDYYVIQAFPDQGLLVFDQSNIGFQFLLAVFFAVIQLIASLISRYNYKVATSPYNNQYFSYSRNMYTPSEQTLFRYMRKYDDILPQRFHSDILLRIVFYTFMAIEDHNRPAIFRHFERILARLGLARTTGIMQQFSPKLRVPLSDEESVLIGAAKIEKIWDVFLSRYAKLCSNGDESIFCFTSSWYSYSYQSLASELYPKFNMLYGEYCGTRELPASVVYSVVRDFEEKNWFKYVPSTVYVTYNLFPFEANLFGDKPLVWINDSTFSPVSLADEDFTSGHLFQISRTSNVKPETLEEALRTLEASGGAVHRVRIICPFLCTIQFSCPDPHFDKDLFTSWKIKAVC